MTILPKSLHMKKKKRKYHNDHNDYLSVQSHIYISSY